MKRAISILSLLIALLAMSAYPDVYRFNRGRSYFGTIRKHGGTGYTEDNQNKLHADPNMAAKHRQAQLLATVKKPEKSISEINEELIREYETFHFASKYNGLVATFNERKDELDIEETQRLLDEFQRLNLTCYRLIYTPDASPRSKGIAMKNLSKKYQDLVLYKDRIETDSHKTLETKIAELEADLKSCQEMVSSLNDDVDALTRGKKSMEGDLEAKNDKIEQMTNTITGLRRSLASRNKTVTVLSILSSFFLIWIVIRICI